MEYLYNFKYTKNIRQVLNTVRICQVMMVSRLSKVCVKQIILLLQTTRKYCLTKSLAHSYNTEPLLLRTAPTYVK